MTFNYEIDPLTSDILFSGRVTSVETMSQQVAVAIGRQLVDDLTTMIVKEHGAAIVAKIDFSQIAQLAIVQAASRIADKIQVGK